ncbi:MAG: response regulator transcription factor [Gammaproteobacteria bacterium]|nr:response regulator transcription factor [Gammaproteobacteria bacterium]MBV9727754.1 response regulator transcription factor [Gammaproteobacteria bacterium]
MVDIIVAACEASVRTALHRQLQASGLSAALEVDIPAALAPAVAELREPLLLSGVHWPETAPYLESAIGCGIAAALLLEEESLEVAHPAFRRGAAVLLPWPTTGARLAYALEAIAHGLRIVPDAARPQQPTTIPTAPPLSLRPPRSILSSRERALLELVAAGLGNKAIARSLGLSINTVKYHLASIFAKLDARTRAEAVSAAARRGELLL